MSFNPDTSKRAQEVIFSRKINDVNHLRLLFKNTSVQNVSIPKHLRTYLDQELTFKHHINEKISRSIDKTEPPKGIGFTF